MLFFGAAEAAPTKAKTATRKRKKRIMEDELELQRCERNYELV